MHWGKRFKQLECIVVQNIVRLAMCLALERREHKPMSAKVVDGSCTWMYRCEALSALNPMMASAACLNVVKDLMLSFE